MKIFRAEAGRGRGTRAAGRAQGSAHHDQLFLTPPQKGRPPFTLHSHQRGQNQVGPEVPRPCSPHPEHRIPKSTLKLHKAGFCPKSPVLPKSSFVPLIHMKIWENQQLTALMSAELESMRKQTPAFPSHHFYLRTARPPPPALTPTAAAGATYPAEPSHPGRGGGCRLLCRVCAMGLRKRPSGRWRRRSLTNSVILMPAQLRRHHHAFTGIVCSVHGGWLGDSSNSAENTAPGASVPGRSFCGEPHCVAARWNTHPAAQQNKPCQEKAQFYSSKSGICSRRSSNRSHHTACGTHCHLPKYHVHLTSQLSTNQIQSRSPPRTHSDRIRGTTTQSTLGLGPQELWICRSLAPEDQVKCLPKVLLLPPCSNTKGSNTVVPATDFFRSKGKKL